MTLNSSFARIVCLLTSPVVFTITDLGSEPSMTDDDSELEEQRDLSIGPAKPAEDPSAPRRHFRVPDHADIQDADAETVYQKLKAQVVAAYGASESPIAKNYEKWMRYNSAPYRNGRRFMNTYANKVAGAYLWSIRKCR